MIKFPKLKLFTFLLLSLSFSSFVETDNQQNLQITVSNIKSMNGNIMVAVYDASQKFLGDEMVTGKTEAVTKTGEMTITIDDLQFGEYAISIYHDENANKTLDTNLFKVPSEPYGFSNDARGSFGPPSYEDARIIFNSNDQNIEINLK